MKDKIKNHIEQIYTSMSIFSVAAISCMIFDIATGHRYQPLTILITVISIFIICITVILACIASLAGAKTISDEEIRGIAKDRIIDRCVLQLLLWGTAMVLQISQLF